MDVVDSEDIVEKGRKGKPKILEVKHLSARKREGFDSQPSYLEPKSSRVQSSGILHSWQYLAIMATTTED